MKTIERHRYKDKEIFQTRTLTYNPYPMTEIESVMELISAQRCRTEAELRGFRVFPPRARTM